MFLLALPYLIQIGFIYHAIRNGKNMTWIWILIALPVVGGVLYFIMEVVPDLRSGRSLDPDRLIALVDKDSGIRKLREKIHLSDTVANRLELGDELFRRGAYTKAMEEFDGLLKGHYQNEPGILVRAAKSAFLAGRYPEAIGYYERCEALGKLTATEQKLHLAYARFVGSPSTETLQPLTTLFEITRSYEVATYLVQAALHLQNLELAQKVHQSLEIQLRQAEGPMRKIGRENLRKIEKALRDFQA